jgi:pimeloyl-ACP methyl ester carboxylesterase
MTDTTTRESRPRPENVALTFLKPLPPRQRRQLKLVGGVVQPIATPEGEVAIHRAGAGPAVLLLHGWEGQASDMAAFAPPLIELGFSVLVMDLPAHGDSAGTQSSIPQAARALGAVVAKLGPLHAAITHSMGSPILAEALSTGLPVARVVLIAAPAYYERYARGFAAAAGLDAEGTEAMLALLSDTIGVDVRELSLPRRAQHLRQPALFIHSSDDRVVAIEDSLTTVAAWPGARHMRVEELGHQRILSDPTVVASAITFVTAMP